MSQIYATGGGGGSSGPFTSGRAGSTSVANGATSKAVTFSSPMPDTNFSINVLFTNTVDANPQFQPVSVTALSVNGFTATWNGGLDSANYVLNYIVVENA